MPQIVFTLVAVVGAFALGLYIDIPIDEDVLGVFIAALALSLAAYEGIATRRDLKMRSQPHLTMHVDVPNAPSPKNAHVVIVLRNAGPGVAVIKSVAALVSADAWTLDTKDAWTRLFASAGYSTNRGVPFSAKTGMVSPRIPLYLPPGDRYVLAELFVGEKLELVYQRFARSRIQVSYTSLYGEKFAAFIAALAPDGITPTGAPVEPDNVEAHATET